ncbi:MAG: hypothetical protein ACHQT8_04605 [Chlamydiales bacterium]
MSVDFNLSAFLNLQKEVSTEMLARISSRNAACDDEIERALLACSDHPNYVAPKREPLDTRCMEFALQVIKEFNPAVHEFTRRILPAEKVKICRLIGQHKAYPTLEELRAFKKCEFDHVIFDHEKWPLFVLSALFMGKLSIEEAIRLFLFDACAIHMGGDNLVEIFSLENDVEAEEVLREGVKGYLSDEELNAFFERMRKLPREETIFFTCHLPFTFDLKKLEKRDETTWNLLELLYHRVKFTLLLIPDFKCNRVTQVVLPPKLVQMLYSMKFGNQTIKPNPVLGRSVSGKNFEDPSKRDVLVPCRYVRQPEEADSYYASPMIFYYHDAAYHAWLESSIPHRAAWIEIAGLFKKQKDTVFYGYFLDKEFNLYANMPTYPFLARVKLPDPTHIFWATLVEVIVKGAEDSRFDGADTLSACEKIVMHIFSNRVRWQQDYGIVLSPDVNACEPLNNILCSLKNMGPNNKNKKFGVWFSACHEVRGFVINSLNSSSP